MNLKSKENNIEHAFIIKIVLSIATPLFSILTALYYKIDEGLVEISKLNTSVAVIVLKTDNNSKRIDKNEYKIEKLNDVAYSNLKEIEILKTKGGIYK